MDDKPILDAPWPQDPGERSTSGRGDDVSVDVRYGPHVQVSLESVNDIVGDWDDPGFVFAVEDVDAADEWGSLKTASSDPGTRSG